MTDEVTVKICRSQEEVLEYFRQAFANRQCLPRAVVGNCLFEASQAEDGSYRVDVLAYNSDTYNASFDLAEAVESAWVNNLKG